MMTFLTLIIYLAGFAFGILGIIGLFSPIKGGFWMKFLKTPKRLPVFGLNFIAFVLLLVAGGQIVMSDNYGYGISSLESKNFNSAITSFEKLKKSDKHFSEKEQLIQSVYDSAKEHYSAQINSLIADIDQDAAILSNNEYKELTGELLFPDSTIKDEITKNIDGIKKQVSEYMEQQSYEDALRTADKLAKTDSLKDYIAGIHGDVRDVQLKAVKAQIEGYIHDKNYIEAQKLLAPMQNDDFTKTYAIEQTDNISELLRNQLKSLIGLNITASDFVSAKSNLQALTELGGDDDFIDSTNNKIKEIENQIQFEIIILEVNDLVVNNKFESARSKVRELVNFDTSESDIMNLTEQINTYETEYKADKKEQLNYEYMINALDVSYADLLRYPDEYLNKVISVSGEIDQKISDGEFRMSTKYIEYIGYNGDPVVFLSDDGGFIVGDQVVVYGTYLKLNSYSTTNGSSIDAPKIKARIVDMWLERE